MRLQFRVVWLCALGSACSAEPAGRTPYPGPPAQATVACLSAPDTRLTYDAACSVAEDCRVAWSLLDCCGTVRAVGVAKRAAAKLERQLHDCSTVASCECLAGPTELDSGERASDPEEITLACERGRCATRLARPPTTSGRATRSPLGQTAELR